MTWQVRQLVSLGLLGAANVVPLMGVITFGWDAGMIILFYWFENIIIGAFNILKIVLLPSDTIGVHLSKLFFIPFFLIHYGGFCAVHGVFVLVFTQGMGDGAASPMADMDISFAWGPFIFVGLLLHVLSKAIEVLPRGSDWGILALTASHGISLMLHYWRGNEQKEVDVKQLMMEPYKRVVLLHVVIIAGGAPVMMMGSPLPLLILLVIGKTVLDAVLHFREHRKFREQPKPEA
jgi:hypothetical protein